MKFTSKNRCTWFDNSREKDLIELSNHRSGVFITTQHDKLVNRLDKIDYEIDRLKNCLNKKIIDYTKFTSLY